MNINEQEESKQTDNSEVEKSATSSNENAENDSSLQALVNEEQSYVRQRLQEETSKEPTQEGIDRWLSEQTEGY